VGAACKARRAATERVRRHSSPDLSRRRASVHPRFTAHHTRDRRAFPCHGSAQPPCPSPVRLPTLCRFAGLVRACHMRYAFLEGRKLRSEHRPLHAHRTPSLSLCLPFHCSPPKLLHALAPSCDSRVPPWGTLDCLWGPACMPGSSTFAPHSRARCFWAAKLTRRWPTASFWRSRDPRSVAVHPRRSRFGLSASERQPLRPWVCGAFVLATRSICHAPHHPMPSPPRLIPVLTGIPRPLNPHRRLLSRRRQPTRLGTCLVLTWRNQRPARVTRQRSSQLWWVVGLPCCCGLLSSREAHRRHRSAPLSHHRPLAGHLLRHRSCRPDNERLDWLPTRMHLRRWRTDLSVATNRFYSPSGDRVQGSRGRYGLSGATSSTRAGIPSVLVVRGPRLNTSLLCSPKTS